MFSIIRSSAVTTFVQRTVNQKLLAPQRGFHKVSLVTLHQTLHQKTDSVPQLHGLRLYDHQTYKISTISPTSSVKESKMSSEPRSSCTRQGETDISPEVAFREVHGRVRTLPNLDIGDVSTASTINTVVEDKPAQAVGSHVGPIACSGLPAEKETKMEHEVKIEARKHAPVRRGLNPFLSRARPETEKKLCAADLDNIYNP